MPHFVTLAAEAAAVGLCVVDASGQVMWLNETARDLLNRPHQAVPFEFPASEVVVQEIPIPLRDRLAMPVMDRWQVMRLPDGAAPLWVRIAPQRHRGTDPFSVLTLSQSVDDVKRSSAALSPEDEMARIAHEQRNALAILTYAISLARTTEDPVRAQQHLDEAERAVQETDVLFRQLRDLSFAPYAKKNQV